MLFSNAPLTVLTAWQVEGIHRMLSAQLLLQSATAVGCLLTALLQAAGPDAATVITQLGLKNSHLRDELLLLDMKRVSHIFDTVTPLSPPACIRLFGFFSLK